MTNEAAHTGVPPRRTRARLLLLLALLAGWALRLLLLDAYPLREDEALYSFWARSVWSDPRFLTIFPDKPPLFLWLQALALQLFGVSSAAARLLNIFASTATITLVAACARQIMRAQPLRALYAAIVSAWLVALNPFSISFAATAYTDALLVFWGIASVACALRGRMFWAGALLGAAIMTKQQGLLFAPLVGLLYLIPGPSPVGVGGGARSTLSGKGETTQPAPFGEGRSARAAPSRKGRSTLPLLLEEGRSARWLSGWSWLVAGCLLVVVPVLVWDASRWAVAPSPWALGVQNYAALGLAELGDLARRAQAWGALLWYGAGSLWAWLLLGLLALAGGSVWWRATRKRTATHARWTLLVFLVWMGGFLAVHLFSTVQPWDRYLLPLFPVAAILLGSAVGALLAQIDAQPAKRARTLLAGCALLAAIVLASPAWTAARGGFPIGADHGAYSGLDEAVQWVEAQVASSPGRPFAVYHRVLGWNLQYALFDAVASGDVELRWFSNAVYLADNVSKSPWRRNLVIEPVWGSTRDLPMQSAARALLLEERLRVGGMTIYEITARTTAYCVWCQCSAPQRNDARWSVLPMANADAYRTPLSAAP